VDVDVLSGLVEVGDLDEDDGPASVWGGVEDVIVLYVDRDAQCL
jgi:hypothetical protein